MLQVLLGEVSAGLSTTQVVVKELKASASIQDQMQFMEEVQPYRLVPQRPHSSDNFRKSLEIKNAEIQGSSVFCFRFQNPPAPRASAVLGAVLGGHSVSTGHGVLPSGLAKFFPPSFVCIC